MDTLYSVFHPLGSLKRQETRQSLCMSNVARYFKVNYLIDGARSSEFTVVCSHLFVALEHRGLVKTVLCYHR